MNAVKTIFKNLKLVVKTMFSDEITQKVTGCCASQSEEVLQGRMKRDRERQNH